MSFGNKNIWSGRHRRKQWAALCLWVMMTHFSYAHLFRFQHQLLLAAWFIGIHVLCMNLKWQIKQFPVSTQNHKRWKQSIKSEDPTRIAAQLTLLNFSQTPVGKSAHCCSTRCWAEIAFNTSLCSSKVMQEKGSSEAICGFASHTSVLILFFLNTCKSPGSLQVTANLKAWKSFNQIPSKMKSGPHPGSASNYTCEEQAKSLKEDGNISIHFNRL